MLGSLLSIVTVVSLLTYATVQLQVMYGREDYRVQLRDEVDYFSRWAKFGRDQGFFVAFGMTSDKLLNVELDPSIGELHFYQKIWRYEQALA